MNVPLSRIRVTVHPRSVAAVSNPSAAVMTSPRPWLVKKSRSWVGRAVRCWASSAAPPAMRKPALLGKVKNRRATAI